MLITPSFQVLKVCDVQFSFKIFKLKLKSSHSDWLAVGFEYFISHINEAEAVLFRYYKMKRQ